VTETILVSGPSPIDAIGVDLATRTRQDLLTISLKSEEHSSAPNKDSALAIDVTLRMPSSDFNAVAHRVAQAGCVVSDRRRRRYPGFQRGEWSAGLSAECDQQNGLQQSLMAELQEQIAARAFSQIQREAKVGSITVVLAEWVLSWLIKRMALMFVRWLFSDSKNAGVACSAAENSGLVVESE
jgi:hypothetical protein